MNNPLKTFFKIPITNNKGFKLRGIFLTFEAYTENFEKLMEKELKLIKQFSGIEEQLKELLIKKEWVLLEKSIRDMKKIADSIVIVEAKRDASYQAMKLYCRDDNIKSFSLFISMFCPDRKEIILTLYRELKIGVLKVKNTTMRIDTYVNTVVSTVDKVLDEVYPIRKGIIYDMSGTDRHIIHQPMILDQEL